MSTSVKPGDRQHSETSQGAAPEKSSELPKGEQDTANQISRSQQKKRSKSIGHYILSKTLGEGTFGKVKLATHILTGEKVAIKILEKERIVDVSDVERVSREIHILKLLRHSNIIQLYEIIETPKQLFLVMEYAQGGELFDYIVANQKVKEREAWKFFQQIINGIEYIHKLNIVHRDMKPENLLLSDSKTIKIVDFGLSNTYKKNELLKTACGSPCYAAPEMIAGKRYQGLNVDIWSCGVILYALICGYLPFEDPNTAQLYKKILAGDYTIPKFVSQEGRDLIKGILNTDPQKRFTISDIRKHPWYNQSKPLFIPEGIIVGYNKIPVDMEIVKQAEKFGFNSDYAVKCIEANKHNHVTTTYYLLLKKHLQAGGASNADISSETFDAAQCAPNKRPSKTPVGSQLNPQDLLNNSHLADEKEKSKYSSRRESNSKDHTSYPKAESSLNQTTQHIANTSFNQTMVTQGDGTILLEQDKLQKSQLGGQPAQLPHILQQQTQMKKSIRGSIQQQQNQLNFTTTTHANNPNNNNKNTYFYESAQQSPSPFKYLQSETASKGDQAVNSSNNNTLNSTHNGANNTNLILMTNPQHASKENNYKSIHSQQPQQQQQQYQIMTQQQQVINMKYPTVPNSNNQSPRADRFSYRMNNQKAGRVRVTAEQSRDNSKNNQLNQDSYISSSEHSRHSSMGHNGGNVLNSFTNKARITNYPMQGKQNPLIQNKAKLAVYNGLKGRHGSQVNGERQQYTRERGKSTEPYSNTFQLNTTLNTTQYPKQQQQQQQQAPSTSNQNGNLINVGGRERFNNSIHFQNSHNISYDHSTNKEVYGSSKTGNNNNNTQVLNSSLINDLQEKPRGGGQYIQGLNNHNNININPNTSFNSTNPSVNVNQTNYSNYARRKMY